MSTNVKNNYYINYYMPASTPRPQQNRYADEAESVESDDIQAQDDFGSDASDFAVDDGSGSFAEPDSTQFIGHDLTRRQVLELYNVLEAKVESSGGDGDDALVSYLDTLKDALRDLKDGNMADAWQEYSSVDSALNGGEAEWSGDPLADGVDQEAFEDSDDSDSEIPEGASPTRTDEDGTKHFEASESGQGFEISADGDESLSFVDTDGEVTIRALNPQKDEVTIKEAGKYTVVKIEHDGKVETFKVSQRASLHVTADKIKGTAANLYEKITVGSGESSSNFVSEETRKSVASRIANGRNFGSYFSWEQFKEMNDDYGQFNMYNELYNAEAADVQQVLALLSESMTAPDADHRNELQHQAVEMLHRWKTQFPDPEIKAGEADTGNFNLTSRTTTLFSVLYGELGESDFKNALETGLIPAEFAQQLSSLLNDGHSGDNFRNHYVGPASGFTFETMAEFLTQHANPASSVNELFPSTSDESSNGANQATGATEEAAS